jgi:hypothetical protein
MITIEQAVSNAIEHVNRFSNVLPTGGVRLEEFEFDDAKNEWVITLSFLDSPISSTRAYKTLVIDGHSGDLRSMRIRNPFTRP